MKEIDWSSHDRFPENTVQCGQCGDVFRTHSKYVSSEGICTRKPCPRCGCERACKASSDPEYMTISGRG